MRLLWLWAFFLYCKSLQKAESDEDRMKITYADESLERYPPIDFRCFQLAHSRFNFTQYLYRTMYYIIDIKLEDPTIGCRTPIKGGKKIFYPLQTALDPMMTFYIHKIHEGLAIIPDTQIALSYDNKMENRKQYCMDLRLIAPTFIDYFEIFHSDNETCWKLKEIVAECSNFQQMWEIWVRKLYDKFCLDEDGCYNVMELYDEDMPYCVKYIASSQFQNASFGSWHHSILNYCELTDMVPQAKDDNYDRTILNEDGKTDNELLTMCQFLRFRLLPEEGKEEEIREITLRGTIGVTDKDAEGAKNCAAYYSLLVHVTLAVYDHFTKLSCRF